MASTVIRDNLQSHGRLLLKWLTPKQTQPSEKEPFQICWTRRTSSREWSSLTLGIFGRDSTSVEALSWLCIMKGTITLRIKGEDFMSSNKVIRQKEISRRISDLIVLRFQNESPSLILWFQAFLDFFGKQWSLIPFQKLGQFQELTERIVSSTFQSIAQMMPEVARTPVPHCLLFTRLEREGMEANDRKNTGQHLQRNERLAFFGESFPRFGSGHWRTPIASKNNGFDSVFKSKPREL